MRTGSRQRHSKPAPIDLAEMEKDPGLRGMLSFLEVPPEEKARLIALREGVERATQPPMGHSPMGLSVEATETSALAVPSHINPPMGHSPMGQSAPRRAVQRPPAAPPPPPPAVFAFTPEQIAQPPFINLPGNGRRRLHYCREVQDAHTAAEIVAYQALWLYAKKFGRPDETGYTIDVGLSRICEIWKTDHKHAKRLLAALETKQNLEIIRQPNYQLSLATRYRIFNFTQIYERRRARGLLWVVKTRTTQFVDLETVNRLFTEQFPPDSPMGLSPMGHSLFEGDSPMGHSPHRPMGQQPDPPMGHSPTDIFIKELSKGKKKETSSSVFVALTEATGHADDDAVRRIVASCRAVAPDATDQEIAYFVRFHGNRFRQMRAIDNPMGMLIKHVPKCFEGESLRQFRAAEQQRREAEQRQTAQLRAEAERILADADSEESDKQWARQILATAPSA